jgi:hypothetical protein
MQNLNIRKANISDAENLLNYFKKVGSETGFLTFDSVGVGMTVKEEIEYLKQYEEFVVTTNDRAIKLYKKFGFEIEGEMKRMMKIGNEYFDEYVMSLIM